MPRDVHDHCAMYTGPWDQELFNYLSEEVGHGLKGIMVDRLSESRTLFYRGHEINMAAAHGHSVLRIREMNGTI